MDAALAEAFEISWPASEYADAGGFRVGRGLGAGGRVSSARAVGAWRGDHIDAAIAIHRGWDQRPVFRVADDDAALAGALESRGFRRETPTAVMATATRALTDIAIPSVTTFTLWPPLAIQREIWAAGNIGPARQAVIERVAPSDLAVVIEGETGTGKELVARAIHQRSRRSYKPYLVFDCSAFPANLLETELFGHERGAFSGAIATHRGVFERADGGTIFFDELGEMSRAVSPKFLRVLETGEVRRVGGERDFHVDVRI
ncbi:MAG: sigma-54 factor interaction domain-containing protein, partial [Paracoccus sp. (in: a-proteobacteria)]